MPFDNKVDYMPNQTFSNGTIDISDAEHKQFKSENGKS